MIDKNREDCNTKESGNGCVLMPIQYYDMHYGKAADEYVLSSPKNALEFIRIFFKITPLQMTKNDV